MINNNPKILILTGNSGHLSMAEAAKEAYETSGFTVKIKNITSNNGVDLSGFKLIYTYLPFLMNVPYKVGKNLVAQKLFNTIAGKEKLKELKIEISKFNPDIILSTAYYLDPAIKKIKSATNNNFFYFYLTHEPWTKHPLLYPNTPNLIFVYDQKAKKMAASYGVDKKKVIPIGWLVRSRFYQDKTKEKAAILKKLKFNKQILTILICAGSGTSAVLKILPALFSVSSPIQVIFIAGGSNTTYNLAKSTASILNKSFANWESKVKMRVFNFTKDIDNYMSISDLIVGKAGPQLLFESIATEKPFFAISHLAGHQDSVLEIIKKKRFGFVEENPQKAIKLFLKITNNLKILNRFKSHIRKEKQHNFATAENLVNETLNFWKTNNKKLN